MIYNANEFIHPIITHHSANVRQDVADKVMTIKSKFIDGHNDIDVIYDDRSHLWLTLDVLCFYYLAVNNYIQFSCYFTMMSKFLDIYVFYIIKEI